MPVKSLFKTAPVLMLSLTFMGKEVDFACIKNFGQNYLPTD